MRDLARSEAPQPEFPCYRDAYEVVPLRPDPTPEEQARVQAMLQDGRRDGAHGVALGGAAMPHRPAAVG